MCVRKSRWIEWADLLKRVFALEVLACVCGGRRRVIAVLKDPQVVRRRLEHLELPANAPRLEPAHEEPQPEWWPTGPPHDEFTQPPAQEEFDQRWGTIDFAQ